VVADVCSERRVSRLHWHEARVVDAVEEPLSGAQQHGQDVEGELVDYACL